MTQQQKSSNKLKGKDLEKYGYEIFNSIGLICCSDLPQVRLNDITSGYAADEHLEFDYLIPYDKICLIGEITARSKKDKIKEKYNSFVNNVDIIRRGDLSCTLWTKLGVKDTHIKYFREIQSIKSFFIVSEYERVEINLPKVDNLAVFYKSDLRKIKEYSDSIGVWTKNYFLNTLCIEERTNSAISIYAIDNSLIISKNKSPSSSVQHLCDLYTFTISPYDLLDIAHVQRKDELPSLQNNTYNYQRLLDGDKLKNIRKILASNPDFIFPTDILFILSNECKYTKDGSGEEFLYIPRRYGSVSVIDGQHRLLSYADSDIKDKISIDSKIRVTAIDLKSTDEEVRRRVSASIFIEINTNQTKIELSHLDRIAYELGREDPKVIATKILISIHEKGKFGSLFDINKQKSGSRGVEVGIIIDSMKKITNLNKISNLQNPRSDKTKAKKSGYENLFGASVEEISAKNMLVERGIIVFERYFNEILSIFKHDKIQDRSEELKSSFLYSKFWAGFAELLDLFIQEGLDWDKVRNELISIRANVMKLRDINEYKELLFDAKDINIPDASSSPQKTCIFLNKNRQNPTSITSI